MRTLILLLILAAQAAAQPARIISAAPSVTEMLFALGAGKRVVGVTTFCHFPPEARKLPKVGTYLQLNMETVTSLRPDLVVLLKNPTQQAAQLRGMKLRVLELEHETVTGIFRSIQRLGDATGTAPAAARLSNELRSELDQIRARTSKLPRKKIMFIVGRNPGTLDGMVAAGRASYLNELMSVAGGVNIFEDSPAAYPKVNLEEIIARNPDVIVDMGDMAQTVGVTEERKRAVAALWKRGPAVNAVKTGRIFPVAADIYVVPGPRMGEVALAFARMLHPEAGL